MSHGRGGPVVAERAIDEHANPRTLLAPIGCRSYSAAASGAVSMREKYPIRAIRMEPPTLPTPRRRLLMLAAPLLVAGHAPETGIAAQEPAPIVSDARRAGLETIVVTAQKRSEDLQDVEMAVAVFSGD